jgi:hypothetical protein
MATVTKGSRSDWSEVLEQLVRKAVAPLDDRREGLRLPFFREIRLASSDGETDYGFGFSRDLTPRGLGVMHQSPILDEIIRLRVSTSSGPIECRGRVIWTRTIGAGWFFSGCELSIADTRKCRANIDETQKEQGTSPRASAVGRSFENSDSVAVG